MKKDELRNFLNNLIQEYEEEEKKKLYKVEIFLNGSVLRDLRTLQQRFGAKNLAESLETSIALAKSISDKIERGAVILFLERYPD